MHCNLWKVAVRLKVLWLVMSLDTLVFMFWASSLLGLFVWSFGKRLSLCGLPRGSVVKSLPANAGRTGDADSIPGLGSSPGEGNGKPPQYSCLENPIDTGAWWTMVCRVTKSQTGLSNWVLLQVLLPKPSGRGRKGKLEDFFHSDSVLYFSIPCPFLLSLPLALGSWNCRSYFF